MKRIRPFRYISHPSYILVYPLVSGIGVSTFARTASERYVVMSGNGLPGTRDQGPGGQNARTRGVLSIQTEFGERPLCLSLR